MYDDKYKKKWSGALEIRRMEVISANEDWKRRREEMLKQRKLLFK